MFPCLILITDSEKAIPIIQRRKPKHKVFWVLLSCTSVLEVYLENWLWLPRLPPLLDLNSFYSCGESGGNQGISEFLKGEGG